MKMKKSIAKPLENNLFSYKIKEIDSELIEKQLVLIAKLRNRERNHWKNNQFEQEIEEIDSEII